MRHFVWGAFKKCQGVAAFNNLTKYGYLADKLRYSTIGRPRVASPSSRGPLLNDGRMDDCDLADPRSLTLSRSCSDQDHVLYG